MVLNRIQRKQLIKFNTHRQGRRILNSQHGGKISFRKMFKKMKNIATSVYKNPIAKKIVDIGLNIISKKHPNAISKLRKAHVAATKAYDIGDKAITSAKNIKKFNLENMQNDFKNIQRSKVLLDSKFWTGSGGKITRSYKKRKSRTTKLKTKAQLKAELSQL
jgi:hypothetical protein